jgi:bifunctional glutamyl/prolyl-tRNA synthetase
MEYNMNMWTNMVSGLTQNCCLRLKLNMKDNNGCMMDPVLCRNVNKEHQHTRDKFKVYPTYDFACPIVDFVEGVTHVLRSTEFNDRDEQYKAILEQLGVQCPLNYFITEKPNLLIRKCQKEK